MSKLPFVLGPPIVTPIGPGMGVSLRLADSVRKCVVFFGLNDKYGGTGFLIDRPAGMADRRERYLVTAAHVARALGDIGFTVRANLKTGEADYEEPDHVQWTYHDDHTIDIAVTPFEMPPRFDCCYLGTESFVDETTREKIGNIGVGSLAHIVGLFRLHRGEKRQLPIVHSGHIALESTDEPIPTFDRNAKIDTEVKGYLIEAQTLEGLSGSPVFARRSIAVEVGRDVWGVTYWAYGPAFLLGVYHGAWDGRPGVILAEDRDLNEDTARIPVGMGIVAPATGILEILRSEDMRRQRDLLRQNEAMRRAAKADNV